MVSEMYSPPDVAEEFKIVLQVAKSIHVIIKSAF